MKIYPLGAKLLRAHRQTDTAKLMDMFCNFRNMPKSVEKNCGNGNEHSIDHGQLLIKYNSKNIKLGIFV